MWRRTLWCVGTAWLVLGGCSNGSDSDEDTPEAEPSPTPVPVNEYFSVDTLWVGESWEGLDLDGDGQTDNSLEETLVLMNATLYGLAEESLAASELPVACEEDGNLCQDEILEDIGILLNFTFSIDGLTGLLNVPLTTNDVVIGMYFVGGVDADVALTWSQEGLWDGEPGVQGGTMNLGGYGWFGPDETEVFFRLPLYDPLGGVHWIDMPFTLYLWNTEAIIKGKTDLEWTTGGALSIEDLLDTTAQMTDIVNLFLDLADVEIEVETALIAMELALIIQADIDISGDGRDDGFSFAILGHAE